MFYFGIWSMIELLVRAKTRWFERALPSCFHFKSREGWRTLALRQIDLVVFQQVPVKLKETSLTQERKQSVLEHRWIYL
jgi:hypothetical protein